MVKNDRLLESIRSMFQHSGIQNTTESCFLRKRKTKREKIFGNAMSSYKFKCPQAVDNNVSYRYRSSTSRLVAANFNRILGIKKLSCHRGPRSPETYGSPGDEE